MSYTEDEAPIFFTIHGIINDIWTAIDFKPHVIPSGSLTVSKWANSIQNAVEFLRKNKNDYLTTGIQADIILYASELERRLRKYKPSTDMFDRYVPILREILTRITPHTQNQFEIESAIHRLISICEKLADQKKL